MPAKQQRQLLGRLRFLDPFLINTLAAAITPFIDWAFSNQLDWRHARLEFEISFVYAQCIGTLLWAGLPRSWRWIVSSSKYLLWVFRLLIVGGISAVGTLLASVIVVYLNLGLHVTFWELFCHNVKMCILLGVTISFVIAVFRTMQHRLEATQLQLRTQELERERALKQATEAKLASLESRIHPHFLFNTINSVSSLIHEDPDRAERLLERMAALLRFSLDSQQNGIVPLEREMKIAADYLEIEKTRFGDRLHYDLSFHPSIGGLGVPPLSVQTLVENSVKYVIAPRRQGGRILVRAQREDHQLVIDVWDDGPMFTLSAIPDAHGLDNLRSRLATLFPGSSSLEIREDAAGKAVRLIMPAEPAVRRTA